METLVDDVGSFPLSSTIDRESYNKAYRLAREAIINGRDIEKDELLHTNFCLVVRDSFKKKCSAGLDVVNYPQHYDMVNQLSDVVHMAMEKGTFLVEEKQAIIPEVYLIGEEAKKLSEEIGDKISLRVSLVGPMELYLKEVGISPYEDVLMGFAETVRRFAKNSILNSKYVKTEVVSLDEPSFGFQDINAGKDTIVKVLEKAFDFGGAVRQIHLHSSAKVADLLHVKNLDVLSFEYAGSPKNIEGVSRKMLDKADKRVRIGVSRTDIDAIMAELYDRGVTRPHAEEIVESEEAISKRFVVAKEKFGDRMTFTGPDCGLGGWPTQEAAQLLLTRSVKAVKKARAAST